MKTLFLLLGLYYFFGALWPLVHIRSFEAICGPKKENWLVYTASALLLGPGLIFIYSGISEDAVSPISIALALSQTLGLALIDIILVLRKVIWKTYLLDALAEVFFFVTILATALSERMA